MKDHEAAKGTKERGTAVRPWCRRARGRGRRDEAPAGSRLGGPSLHLVSPTRHPPSRRSEERDRPAEQSSQSSRLCSTGSQRSRIPRRQSPRRGVSQSISPRNGGSSATMASMRIKAPSQKTPQAMPRHVENEGLVPGPCRLPTIEPTTSPERNIVTDALQRILRRRTRRASSAVDATAISLSFRDSSTLAVTSRYLPR